MSVCWKWKWTIKDSGSNEKVPRPAALAPREICSWVETASANHDSGQAQKERARYRKSAEGTRCAHGIFFSFFLPTCNTSHALPPVHNEHVHNLEIHGRASRSTTTFLIMSSPPSHSQDSSILSFRVHAPLPDGLNVQVRPVPSSPHFQSRPGNHQCIISA